MLPAVEPTDLSEGGGDDADEGLGLFDARGLDLTPVVDDGPRGVDERLRDVQGATGAPRVAEDDEYAGFLYGGADGVHFRGVFGH
jgi:hypothetical protein